MVFAIQWFSHQIWRDPFGIWVFTTLNNFLSSVHFATLLDIPNSKSSINELSSTCSKQILARAQFFTSLRCEKNACLFLYLFSVVQTITNPLEDIPWMLQVLSLPNYLISFIRNFVKRFLKVQVYNLNRIIYSPQFFIHPNNLNGLMR